MRSSSIPRPPGVVTRLEAGLDWLSATLAVGHNLSAQTYEAGMRYLDGQHEQGNAARPATLLGYKGVMCGKCFVGDSEQGLYLRSTSGGSTGFFEHIYHPDMHVSRLDMQVTVWVEDAGYHVGKEARSDAAYWRLTHPRDGKRKITAIDSEDGGYTLYIGSKSSLHFCRLYDKGAESNEEYYKGAWRYEIELHNSAATTSALYLLENNLSLEAVVCSTVAQYYRARGVQVPWTASDALNALRPLLHAETDDARSIAWLAAQVKPTVARLINRGYTSSVFEALGLEAPDTE